MKKLFFLLCLLSCLTFNAFSQTNYLTNIKTKNDFRYQDDFINISINYWRFDSCLYEKRICKYNTSTAARIKVYQSDKSVRFVFLRGNNSGYKSEHPYDSLTYHFFSDRINSTFLIRKIWIDKGSVKKGYYIFKTDTFNLTVIDTLSITNQQLIRKAFGQTETTRKKELRIFVLKSVDVNGSIMLHYWVENIGIIKLTDEKCWRYSFEMKDDRTKSIEKMFEKILLTIKAKYKDPKWPSEPCYFE